MNMDTVIESNIPMPRPAGSHQRVGLRRQYPWRAMETGNSFFVSNQDPGAPTEGTLRHLACLNGKRHGKRFSVAKVEGGVRVWRVA